MIGTVFDPFPSLSFSTGSAFLIYNWIEISIIDIKIY